MYLDAPYPGYSWYMNHHMGKVNHKFLYHLLLGAELHRDEADPALYINNYLVVNQIIPPNVRSDTGQPEGWRDYQQILCDFGLMFSTRYTSRITLTPIGNAYLDGSLSFSEVMTLQATRLQYPNGHRNDKKQPSIRGKLRGTSFDQYNTLTEIQARSGVRVRPAALIWRVLSFLRQQGETPVLTTNEIRQHVMRCIRHEDTEICTNTLIAARNDKSNLDRLGTSRDVQEWYFALKSTPYFLVKRGRTIELAPFAVEHLSEINGIFSCLEQDSSFWEPQSFNQSEFLSWYEYFGSLDLGIPTFPFPPAPPQVGNSQIRELLNELKEVDNSGAFDRTGGSINLREFDLATSLPSLRRETSLGMTINTSYDVESSRSATRTHDSMVKLIAEICRAKGANVMEDPNSIDLLVGYQQNEFVIEVKSVTPQNFVAQLRLAIGQVLQYDYLRSEQSSLPRKRIIAIAARVPTNSWCLSFLRYIGIDLLSLEGRGVRIDTSFDLSNRLFASEHTSTFPNLFG